MVRSGVDVFVWRAPGYVQLNPKFAPESRSSVRADNSTIGEKRRTRNNGRVDAPRFTPNYACSYFSSRGPTGDGRHKPIWCAGRDHVGSAGAKLENREAVESRKALTGRLYARESGTSMGRPHVSGAIAAFCQYRRR